MPNDSVSRYRISIPHDDASVIEWMKCQHSISLSIRQLVKIAIEVNGMRDYFASDYGEIVQKPRRGRPPKTVVEREEVLEVKSVDAPKATESLSPSRSDISDRILAMQGLLNK